MIQLGEKVENFFATLKMILFLLTTIE